MILFDRFIYLFRYLICQAVIERQRAAKEKRSKGPASEKIKERMAEELELLESEYQAQKSLENLLQDRACLTKEMVLIKVSEEGKTSV